MVEKINDEELEIINAGGCMDPPNNPVDIWFDNHFFDFVMRCPDRQQFEKFITFYSEVVLRNDLYNHFQTIEDLKVYMKEEFGIDCEGLE